MILKEETGFVIQRKVIIYLRKELDCSELDFFISNLFGSVLETVELVASTSREGVGGVFGAES